MKDSPFNFGKTVSLVAFTNREEESKKLQANLLGGINTTIIAPRRWGKSSLVEKVIADIAKLPKAPKTVIIDLFTVNSEEQFLELFAKSVIKASSSKWEDWISAGKLFFKNIIPKLSVGIDPNNDFDVSFDWKEIKQNSEEILNLPETIASHKKIKFIICLDEFQNLSHFKDFINVEKRLRAHWQRHKNVTYCLYGSKRQMMTDIFNQPSKPFYRFGDIILLPKIETNKWISFIKSSFENNDKKIDQVVAERIPLIMKNHPWYVQQLSHYVWNLTSKRATMVQLNEALKEVINANSPLYQHEVESLTPTQSNLLIAILSDRKQLTSTKTMQDFVLGTPNNVKKNLTALTQKDLLYKTEKGEYELIDSAFEIWFKFHFMGIKYTQIA